MGVPVLIIGKSGSGKSRSIKNFTKEEATVFSVSGKPLPFKGNIGNTNVSKLAKKKGVTRYSLINELIELAVSKNIKSVILDDTQYLMAFDLFDKAKEKGYDKFTDMAVSFEKLIEYVINETPDDVIIYFLHHIEENDSGFMSVKTIGKMLDQQLSVEGLFTIVLLCLCDENRHYFMTQSKGISTAKSPEGMFELEIENDLKAVDEKIREYWQL